MNRAQLQQLARERIRDAKVLLAAGRWSAAYYIAGYAVECALKACIAKLMKSEEFPDKKFADKCWTHNLAQLLDLAGLKDDFQVAMQADRDLGQNWDTVKEWTEESRYVRTIKAKAGNFTRPLRTRNTGCCHGSSSAGRDAD